MPEEQKYFDVEAAIKANVSKDKIEAFMLKNNLSPKPRINLPQSLPSTQLETSDTSIRPREAISSSVGLPGMTLGLPTSGIDTLRDIQPYISAGAGTVAGAASSLLPGGNFVRGLASSGGSAITDEILNKILFNQAPSTLNIAGNTAINEIGGQILQRLGIGGKNIIKEADTSAIEKSASSYAGSALNYLQAGLAALRDKALAKFAPASVGSYGKGTISGPLSEFDPTFIQMLEEQTGHKSPILSTIEDVFARKSKIEAIDNTMGKIVSKAETQATNLAGTKVPISLTGAPNTRTLDSLADSMRMKTQVNFENLNVEINDVVDQLKPFQEQIRQINKDLALTTKGSPEEKALQTSLKALMKDPTLKDLTNKSKALGEAYSNFVFPGEKGYSTKDFLMKDFQTGRITVDSATGRNATYAKPVADVIMDSDIKLQRFLQSGEITIGKTKITSASPRKEAAGYQFARMLNDSFDSSTNQIDIGKLQNIWNEYKTSNPGVILYNAQTRNNYDQLFKTLSYVTPEMQAGPSKYLALRIGVGGAALGSGLVTGALSGSVPLGIAANATIIGGSIGLHQLGKLMTNPDVARLMIAAVKGGPLSTSNALASRAIFRALRGENLILHGQKEDGSQIDIPAKVNALGKIEEAK